MEPLQQALWNKELWIHCACVYFKVSGLVLWDQWFFFPCGGEVAPSVKGIGFPYCSSSPCGSALMSVPCLRLWDPHGAQGMYLSARWEQSRLLCVLLHYCWCTTTVPVQWKSRKSEWAHVDISYLVSFPCLPPPVNFTTCLHCAMLEDKFACSLQHSWVNL